MRRNLLYAGLLAWFTLWGCRTVDVVNPSYSLRSVTPHVILGIPPAADLDFTIGVDNPNSVALRLDHFDFDLLINDRPMLTNVRSDQGIHIPPRGYSEVHMLAHVNFANMQAIYHEIVGYIQGNSASYQIRGNAYYDTPIGTMRFPVTVGR